MNVELFDLLTKALVLLLMLINFFVVPKLGTLATQAKRWYEQKISAAQRDDLLYYAQKGIKLFEDIYKDKGQGVIKKQRVIEWLAKSGVKFTDEQVNFLIDTIVEFYNANDWKKEITNI